MTLTKLPTTPVITPAMESIIYPDGMPMADNSKQFRYIVTIEGNLEILFANQPDVFLIWRYALVSSARASRNSSGPRRDGGVWATKRAIVAPIYNGARPTLPRKLSLRSLAGQS